MSKDIVDMDDTELIAEINKTEITLWQILREQEQTQHGGKYDILQENGEHFTHWLSYLETEARKRGYRYSFKTEQWVKNDHEKTD